MNRGQAAVMMTAAILVVATLGVGASYFFATVGNHRNIAQLNAREGYYAGEMASWYNLTNSINGVAGYPGMDGSATSIPFPVDYTVGYSGGGSTTLAATKNLTNVHSFIRRQTASNVVYSLPPTGDWCGKMKFAGSADGVCLYNPCSYNFTALFQGPPGDCSLDTSGAICSQYNAMAGRPFSTLNSQTDLMSMQSNHNYVLDRDINLSGTLPMVSLSGVLINGNGHTISVGSATGLSILGSLQNSVVYNLKIAQSISSLPVIQNLTGNSWIHNIVLTETATIANPSPLVRYTGSFIPTGAEHLLITNSSTQVQNPNATAVAMSNGGAVFEVINGTTTLYQDYACGKITNSSSVSMGGLVSVVSDLNSASLNITESFFLGKLSGSAAFGNNVAGLLGAQYVTTSVNITRSGVIGTIAGNGGGAAGLTMGLNALPGSLTIQKSWVKGIGANGAMLSTTVGGAAGLVYAMNNTNLSESYFQGTISYSGPAGVVIGGIAGVIGGNSTISNSYFQGNFTSANGVTFGGLAGSMSGAGCTGSGKQCSASNSYAVVNSVSPGSLAYGVSPPGAVVWSPVNPSSVVWLNTMSNESLGTPLSPAQFANTGNFPAGWDFTNVWQITSNYPTLR